MLFRSGPASEEPVDEVALTGDIGDARQWKIMATTVEDAVAGDDALRSERVSGGRGTFMVDTGIFTGRSPKDKYFVKQDPSQKYIAWGKVNQPISKELFDKLLAKAKAQLSCKEIFIQDAFCGASKCREIGRASCRERV